MGSRLAPVLLEPTRRKRVLGAMVLCEEIVGLPAVLLLRLLAFATSASSSTPFPRPRLSRRPLPAPVPRS